MSYLGVADVHTTLAGVGEDDAGGVHAHLEHHLDLALGRAVKACAQGNEQTQDAGLGVALDGVEGHDAGHGRLPGAEHAQDVGEVNHVEGVVQLVAHNLAAGLGNHALSTACNHDQTMCTVRSKEPLRPVSSPAD